MVVAAVSAASAGVELTVSVSPTPDLPGYNTTIFSLSATGGEEITSLQAEFIGSTLTETSPINQINPSGIPTVFMDSNGSFPPSANVLQDSQFRFDTGVDNLLVVGSVTSESELGLASAFTGFAAFTTRDFAQVTTKEGEAPLLVAFEAIVNHSTSVGLDDLIDISGDFDFGGAIDVFDIDLLADNQGSTSPLFDLDGDGSATFQYNSSGVASDSDLLIRNLLDTEYGDANLDGRVSIADLSLLAQSFSQTGVGWLQGDFNGDRRTSIGDLSILSQNFGFSRDAAPSISLSAESVPEPCSMLVAWLCFLGATPLLRQKRWN